MFFCMLIFDAFIVTLCACPLHYKRKLTVNLKTTELNYNLFYITLDSWSYHSNSFMSLKDLEKKWQSIFIVVHQ